jgi:pimeloyl-ACP methyl ester carboxylesterase
MTTAVRIPIRASNGIPYNLIGIYYMADTADRAALFLHGIPGSEKNHDVAYALRDEGWDVLVLHFGGAWGSGGSYDPRNHPKEALAAVDFLSESHAHIAVMGYSLGSRAALLAAAEDERVQQVVSVSGISDFSEILIERSFFEEASQFLNTDVDTLEKNWQALGSGKQPTDAIKAIAPRPILIAHGTADEVVPFYHADGLAMMGGVERLSIKGANHTFTYHRRDLVKGVFDFLNR